LAKKKKRKYIPVKVRQRAQQEIASVCPFCANEEASTFQPHHIDEDPSNSVIENILMLCSNCHTKVHSGLITRDEVVSMKKYLSTSQNRKQFIKQNIPLKLEIDRIQENFFNASNEDRHKELNKIGRYLEYTNIDLSIYVLRTIEDCVSVSRGSYTSDLLLCVYSELITFIPYPNSVQRELAFCELAEIAINTGFSIVYDSLKYQNSVTLAQYGFLILKFIYWRAQERDLSKITQLVLEQFDSIEDFISKHQSPIQGNAIDMTTQFKEYLNEYGNVLPKYDDHLMKIIELERNESSSSKIKFGSFSIIEKQCAWTKGDNNSFFLNEESNLSFNPVFDFSVINNSAEQVVLNGISVDTYFLPEGLSGFPQPYVIKVFEKYRLNIGQGENSLVFDDPINVPAQASIRLQIEFHNTVGTESYRLKSRILLRMSINYNKSDKLLTETIRLNTEKDSNKVMIYTLM